MEEEKRTLKDSLFLYNNTNVLPLASPSSFVVGNDTLTRQDSLGPAANLQPTTLQREPDGLLRQLGAYRVPPGGYIRPATAEGKTVVSYTNDNNNNNNITTTIVWNNANSTFHNNNLLRHFTTTAVVEVLPNDVLVDEDEDLEQRVQDRINQISTRAIMVAKKKKKKYHLLPSSFLFLVGGKKN